MAAPPHAPTLGGAPELGHTQILRRIKLTKRTEQKRNCIAYSPFPLSWMARCMKSDFHCLLPIMKTDSTFPTERREGQRAEITKLKAQPPHHHSLQPRKPFLTTPEKTISLHLGFKPRFSKRPDPRRGQTLPVALQTTTRKGKSS